MDSWESEALRFATWVRTPGHDSYERYHRDLFFDILPKPGRCTLDVGCGEGRLTRDLAVRGHNVTGIDTSRTLIALAREAPPRLPYVLCDAAHLCFPDGHADLIVFFLALHDFDDYRTALTEAGRVVCPGGRVVLAIPHPLKSAGEWEDGAFVIRGSYLTERRTQITVSRDGLAVTFHSMHRPLSDYFRAFREAGLLVEGVREPRMPDAGAVTERSRGWQRIPLFLHVRLVRPSW